MIVKALRNGLGCIIAGVEQMTRPAKKQRSAEAQAEVNVAASKLALYQFHACPFCIKVRRTLHILNVPVALIDAKDPANEKVLIEQGGKRQVPCLRITDGSGQVTWMYESKQIIDYLNNRFGNI